MQGRTWGAQGSALAFWTFLSWLHHLPAPPTLHATSLTEILCVCPSAGPEVNPALVLEQKRAEEAAAARTASCPKHPTPTDMVSSIYVNYGFELPAKSAGGSGFLPHSGQEF